MPVAHPVRRGLGKGVAFGGLEIGPDGPGTSLTNKLETGLGGQWPELGLAHHTPATPWPCCLGRGSCSDLYGVDISLGPGHVHCH